MIIQQSLFTKEECDSIILYNNTDILNWKMEDRNYYSQPINYSLENNWLFNKLKTFVEENIDIKIKTLKKTIHFHKFTKGDWFGKHNDVRDNRVYAIGVLLNDTFDGGEFKLYNPNEILLNKTVGNSYIFDVTTLHEITPILEGERYSLLWFLQKEHIKFNANKLV
jgi:predicted 2-oxoglutarate/Fe(II)-dependent dioxygenase YbiX